MSKEKQNRRSVLFLGIFTILIAAVAYFQFQAAIYAPFGGASKKQTIKKVQQTQEELNMLIMQDTDKDGLTDFDEQFTYLTSIYITDTDSDAYSDKEEVDAGSNPLDKKSNPYTVEKELGGQQQKGEPTSAKATAGEEEILEKIFPAPEANDQLSIINDQLSAQEIRELLINSGIDKELVDKLDDKTLKSLYNETIQETTEKLTAPE